MKNFHFGFFFFFAFFFSLLLKVENKIIENVCFMLFEMIFKRKSLKIDKQNLIAFSFKKLILKIKRIFFKWRVAREFSNLFFQNERILIISASFSLFYKSEIESKILKFGKKTRKQKINKKNSKRFGQFENRLSCSNINNVPGKCLDNL